MTLFEDLRASGIPYERRGGQLFAHDTPFTRALLARHASIAMGCERDAMGQWWLEMPYVFTPGSWSL